MTLSVGKAIGMNEDIRGYHTTDKLINSQTYLGVEVELEGIHVTGVSEVCPLLESTTDYSLRGDDAGEILFAFPLKGNDVDIALRGIESFVMREKVRPIISSRTSTHVHVDMRDADNEFMRNFIAVYLSVERVLFQHCGKEREDNIFCVPMYKSNTIVRDLSTALSTTDEDSFKDALSRFGEDTRYAALNIHSLWMHGTLEFRHLKGTYEYAKLIEWVNIILSIKQYALAVPLAALQAPKQVDSAECEAYLVDVFGKYADVLRYRGFEKDIVKGTRVAQGLIHGDRQRKNQWDLLSMGRNSSLKLDKEQEQVASKKKKKVQLPTHTLGTTGTQQAGWDGNGSHFFSNFTVNSQMQEYITTLQNTPEDF